MRNWWNNTTISWVNPMSSWGGWLGLLIVVLGGMMGCGAGELSKRGIYIHAVWNEGQGAVVRWSDTFATLSPAHFPLKISVGTLDPRSSLPGGGKTILAGEGAVTVSIPTLPTEGAVVLRSQTGEILDLIVFVGFPEQAVLVRTEQQEEFCHLSWHQTKTCQRVQRSQAPSRLRQIRNIDEFVMLAEDSGTLGLQAQEVKFLIDLQRDQLTHFIHASRWDLHYTFVREEIEQLRHLDRCDVQQNEEFHQGWYDFSEINYAKVEGRQFLLGTLIRYTGTSEISVEFATGDTISGQQMVMAYDIVRRMVDPRIVLKIRPTSPTQLERLQQDAANFREVMAMDTPYQHTTLQLLSPGVAVGKLLALTNQELATTALGLRVIVVLKEVPNDINFVGGIISGQFQSSLSHINVLSRNRGTPHLAIRQAAQQKDIAGLLGKLVRLEVTEKGYSLREASLQEADTFWKEREGKREVFTPALDLSVQELVDLKTAGVSNVSSIGAKAANFAELARVDLQRLSRDSICTAFASQGLIRMPEPAFAIPFYWYIDHMKRSGLQEKLEAYHRDPQFLTDDNIRRTKLAEIQQGIMQAEINPALLTLLEQTIRQRMGTIKVRFRSSTNVEDLADFNGAGLYHSLSVQLDNPKKTVASGLREVWASLWRERAWNERTFFKVNHTKAAMGILVHPSFPDEAANGVVVSTNIFQSNGSSRDTYVAVQQGEVSIVNPEGDITPEQFLIRWYIPPERFFLSRSSLTAGKSVLTEQESLLLGCSMKAIHEHFQPLLSRKGQRFAMEAEFKIDGSPRRLFFKQTRPYIFGETVSSSTCR